jgi:hypothetical protein
LASFFGFAAVGGVAPVTQANAPLSAAQLWIESRVESQSVFFSQAAADLAHVLSMHFPQSLSLKGVGAGAGAALVSGAADADSLGAEDDSGDAADAASAIAASPPSAIVVSPAGDSGGLLDAPQASQTPGTAVMRTSEAAERNVDRFILASEHKHEPGSR